MVWLREKWYGLATGGIVWFGYGRNGMVWHMERNGMVWLREEWYGLATEGMVLLGYGKNGTVCPGSSDPFYIVSYYIKWVTLPGHTVWFG